MSRASGDGRIEDGRDLVRARVRGYGSGVRARAKVRVRVKVRVRFRVRRVHVIRVQNNLHIALQHHTCMN